MQFHDPAIMSLAPPPGFHLPTPQTLQTSQRQTTQQQPAHRQQNSEQEQEQEEENLGWTSGPLIIYTRERMLQLRRYGHVSDGQGRREGEVVPRGMPRRGEGIG